MACIFFQVLICTRLRSNFVQIGTFAVGVFNIFHIVFNISTLLNFITTECFNNSTCFQQIFQHSFFVVLLDAMLHFCSFQLFHILYYYYYNKLLNIRTRARARYARVRACVVTRGSPLEGA
nr:MAG TPA: hypothetical protein [Microviridae sp.]